MPARNRASMTSIGKTLSTTPVLESAVAASRRSSGSRSQPPMIARVRIIGASTPPRRDLILRIIL